VKTYDLFALAGITIILTWGTIFERFRRIYPKFLECPLCVGFWVGMAGSWIRRTGSPIDHLFDAALTSLLSLELVSFSAGLVEKKGKAPTPLVPSLPITESQLPDQVDVSAINEAMDVAVHSKLPPSAQSALEASRQLVK
jgi:hypothetical protein